MENVAITVVYDVNEDADEWLLKAYHDLLVINPFIHAEVIVAHSKGADVEVTGADEGAARPAFCSVAAALTLYSFRASGHVLANALKP
jgi:hypothetical protein